MYSDDDRARDWIEDIVENIDRVEIYVAGLTADTFRTTPMARDACERCLERIAEAAVRLGPERITPETVLHQPRGFGNRLEIEGRWP